MKGYPTSENPFLPPTPKRAGRRKAESIARGRAARIEREQTIREFGDLPLEMPVLPEDVFVTDNSHNRTMHIGKPIDEEQQIVPTEARSQEEETEPQAPLLDRYEQCLEAIDAAEDTGDLKQIQAQRRRLDILLKALLTQALATFVKRQERLGWEEKNATMKEERQKIKSKLKEITDRWKHIYGQIAEERLENAQALTENNKKITHRFVEQSKAHRKKEKEYAALQRVIDFLESDQPSLSDQEREQLQQMKIDRTNYIRELTQLEKEMNQLKSKNPEEFALHLSNEDLESQNKEDLSA